GRRASGRAPALLDQERRDGHDRRGACKRVDPTPRGPPGPASDPLRGPAPAPRLPRGPSTARESGHHEDGYSPASCGGGGVVPVTRTSGGIPTTVVVSMPLRS